MSTISPNKIEIPSKWDIIPIHTSDRETFKQCRRKWDWSSPSRRNLIRKVNIYGVIMPLWFGTGIHYCLQKFYDPALSEDPEKMFEAWFDVEWNGGLVHFNELDYFADREPEPAFHDPTRSSVVDEHTGRVLPAIWKVRGLQELLPEIDYEAFEEHKALGINMMRYYKDYAQRNDNFRVVASEHTFSVPIHDDEGRIIKVVDTRVMPDWWEGDPNEPKEVHARGRNDTIVQDLDSGQYGILEHKTSARIDEDYFRHLDLDEQCTTYLWAAEQEAQLYDLEYKEVSFIIYNALRKAYPKPPTMTTKGLPSIDRQKESTTAYLFDKCIKENGLELVYGTDERMKNYYQYLLEMGESLFIQRGAPGFPYVLRNKAQRVNAGKRLYMEAMDMLDNPRIYHNPTKNFTCLNCVFREPCIQKETGLDYEMVLGENYRSNYDR